MSFAADMDPLTRAQVQQLLERMKQHERGMSKQQRRDYREGVRLQVESILNAPPSSPSRVSTAVREAFDG